MNILWAILIIVIVLVAYRLYNKWFKIKLAIKHYHQMVNSMMLGSYNKIQGKADSFMYKIIKGGKK